MVVTMAVMGMDMEVTVWSIMEGMVMVKDTTVLATVKK